MKTILNLPIPYEFLEGSAKISQNEEMSYIQKFTSALIISSEELELGECTLEDAIKQKLGIDSERLTLVKNEIIELIDKNTDMETEAPLEENIVMISYSFNKNIERKIVVNKEYNLLSTKNRTLNKKIWLPLFNGLDIVEKPNLVNFEHEAKFKRDKIYSIEMKSDIISDYVSKNITSKESIKEIGISEEGDISWIDHEIEFEIKKDNLKPSSSVGQLIIELIDSKKLEYPIETLINKKINDLGIPEKSYKNKIDYEAFKKSKIVNGSDGRIFTITDNEIREFGINERKVNIGNKTINYKEISYDDMLIELFIDSKSDVVNTTIFNKLSLVHREKLIIKRIDGHKFKNIPDELMLKHFSIKIFDKLNDSQIKKLPRIFVDKLIEENRRTMNNNQITKLCDYLKIKNEKAITLFDYTYNENERLFKTWKDEEIMFSEIDRIDKLKIMSFTQKELAKVLKEAKQKINNYLQNQDIVNERILKLEKAIKNASLWTEEEINGNALVLRKKIENYAKSLGNYNSVPESIKACVKVKIANNLIKIWKTLSNEYAHGEITNLKKSEDKLRRLMDSCPALPLSKENLLKGKKHVS